MNQLPRDAARRREKDETSSLLDDNTPFSVQHEDSSDQGNVRTDKAHSEPEPILDFDASAYHPQASLMLEGLSLVESDVFGRFDDIEKWQESANIDHAPLEESKIKTLFQASLGYYSMLLSILVESPTCTEKNISELRRNIKILRQWGEAYSVTDGTLDHLAKHDSDIGETILLFLIEIASILCRKFPLLLEEPLWKQNDKFSRATGHLQGLVHDLRRLDERNDEFQDDELMSEDESGNPMKQYIADLIEYTQLLNELHPTIESYLPITEDAPGPSLKEATDRGAYLYFSDIVRSKFPTVSDALADVLGKVNLDRFNRMAAAREAHHVEEKNKYEVPQTASVGPKSSSFHDSGIGSSLPSVLSPPESAPRTIAPTLSSTLARGSRSKLPPYPKNAKTSFPCDYCGKSVSFSNQREWNKHLIQDLQPYSCLEVECPRSTLAFRDRVEWMEHLGKDHNMSPEWNPVWCILCQDWTQAKVVNVCKHFDDHLVDIALAASPLNITSDAGSDTSPTNTNECALHRTEFLEPISEETMMTLGEEFDDTRMSPSSAENDQTRTRPSDSMPRESKQILEAFFEREPYPSENEARTLAEQTFLSLSIIKTWFSNERTRNKPKSRADPNPTVKHKSELDIAPNCAICNAPAFPECPCESKHLKIVVIHAEQRALEGKLHEARDWVISHARQQILNAYERLASARKASHKDYLVSLPNYTVFMQYSGLPPIHPSYVFQLQTQIAEANAELKRGLDADWRASVIRYPEVLNYFYSLVELSIPNRVPEYVEQFEEDSQSLKENMKEYNVREGLLNQMQERRV